MVEKRLGIARRWFWPAWLAVTLAGLIIVVIQMVDLVGYSGQLVASVMPIEKLAVAGDNLVGQTFVASRPGLERVDVLLYGFRRRNTQPVTFHLRRQGEETDLVSQTFSAAEVWGWRWKRFDFDPMPDSAGQAYVIFFYSPTSTPADSISPSGAPGDVYSQGTAFFLGVPAAGDITFKTYYAGVTLRDKLTALAGRLIEHKPGVWGNIYTYLLLGTVYLFLVACLGYSFYRRSGIPES